MGPPNILVVDDDATIRKVIVQICVRAGYRAEAAADGAEAVSRLKTGRFDLVTMDMMMPNMDGVDAVSVIRSHTDTPIVAISAHLTKGIREDLADIGVVSILAKPFGRDEVLATIAAALEAPR